MMRIVISWRALSESASHLPLLEYLHHLHGHTILVLRETGIESSVEKDGIHFHTVKAHGRWHPSLRVLTNWSKPLEAFLPDVLLGLEEPYSVQSALFLNWACNHSIPFVFLSCQNIDRLLPYPFRVLESWVLSRAQGAWFLNMDAAARARRRGFKGAGRVIPLGVEILERDPVHAPGSLSIAGPVRSETFTAGYVGRLVPEKGVEDLIRACSLSGVRLLVAGDGPERSNLEILARDLKVQTTWLGRIESTRMAEVYSRMDILVLPSISTPRWKEQFGRVLVEAMAHGVPVVGSSSGEIPRVMGEAGLLFPERDSGYLAECINRLRENRQLRETFSLAGQRRARILFSWKQVAGQVNDLILALKYTIL